MKIEDLNDLLTVEEISKYLGLSKSTVYKLVKTGEIPSYRVARSLRFSKSEVSAWINSESDTPHIEYTKPERKRKKTALTKNQEELNNIARDLLMESGLTKGFTSSELEDFIAESECSLRTFPKGEDIILEGETLNKMYIVESGEASILLNKSDTPQASKRKFMRGSIIALDVIFSESRVNYMPYYVEKKCTVLVFQLQAISKYLNSNINSYRCFTRNVVNLLSDENIRRMKNIKILSEKHIRSRILFYLTLEEKKNDGSPFILQEGRMKMAAHLGINRSVLSMELNKMKEDGIIDFNRNTFTIIKRIRR